MENIYRPTYEEYMAKREDIIRRGTTVEEWVKLSMSESTSVEEIVVRNMMNNDPYISGSIAARELRDKHADYTNYICLTYLCTWNTSLSEDLIKDLIYINSGFMMIGCWDQRVIDFVYSMYDMIPQFKQRFDVSNYIMEHIINNTDVDLPKEYVNYIKDMYKQKVADNDSAIAVLKSRLKDYNERLETIENKTKRAEMKAKIENTAKTLKIRKANRKVVKFIITNRLDWSAIKACNRNVSMETFNRFFRAVMNDVESFAV